MKYHLLDENAQALLARIKARLFDTTTRLSGEEMLTFAKQLDAIQPIVYDENIYDIVVKVHYSVSGEWRDLHADGAFESFKAEVFASSPEQAMEDVRAAATSTHKDIHMKEVWDLSLAQKVWYVGIYAK